MKREEMLVMSFRNINRELKAPISTYKFSKLISIYFLKE